MGLYMHTLIQSALSYKATLFGWIMDYPKCMAMDAATLHGKPLGN